MIRRPRLMLVRVGSIRLVYMAADRSRLVGLRLINERNDFDILQAGEKRAGNNAGNYSGQENPSEQFHLALPVMA